MALGQAILDDIGAAFRKQKELADKALAQVADEHFFQKPGEHSNSIATIVKHLAGNLTSRFTDFLTTDGDKASRDRDSEFIIGASDSRANLLAAWEAGWATLLQCLASLTEADLDKTITIRGEPHSVVQALHRSLAHASNHIGQIVYLSRLLTKDDWHWITIPPGQSRQWKAKFMK
jgi:uncharacterized damage-inducible protein DinB